MASGSPPPSPFTEFAILSVNCPNPTCRTVLQVQAVPIAIGTPAGSS